MTAENMPDHHDREIVSARTFPYSRDQVFTAWTNSTRLARWWGPKGFTNTFNEFDLRPGGNWRFVMHGPDGKDYKNHSIFREINDPEKIVFEHISGPQFQVTVTFKNQGPDTGVTFRMLFDSPEVCADIKTYAVEANEQNFDRLMEELSRPV